VSEVLVRGRLTPLLRALGEAECYGGKSRAAHFMVARKQRVRETRSKGPKPRYTFKGTSEVCAFIIQSPLSVPPARDQAFDT
jgi:hypothetical protein